MIRRLFSNPRKVLVQMAAAASASLCFMIMGMVRGWSSPGMPSLMKDERWNGTISEEEESWISSITPLGSILGALIAGPSLTFLGRRKTLMLMSIPYSLGFLLIGFAVHSSMFFIGRFIDGLMVGFCAPAAQIYIGECSSPRVRGALGSFTAVFLSLGILVAYIIGAFVEWDELAWILSAFPILLFGCMWIMPETPSWLLANNREDEARASLQFLRGSHTDITTEFERLKTSFKKSAGENSKIQMKELLKGSVLKPLLLSMGLMFLQQFCGINSVIYFTVFIFDKAGSSIDKNLSTIIVGIVQLVATLGSMFLVDRAGRRILLFVSGFGMAISLAALGAFFYMLELYGEEVQESLGWLPLASLLLFIISFSSGYANVPYLIMGEIFPSKYRPILGSISSSFNLVCAFTIIRTFGDMVKTMGEYGTFWFYMCWCILGLFFVYFFLPETKGRSLEDIEKMFSSKKQVEIHGVVVEPVREVKTPQEKIRSIAEKNSHSNNGYQYDTDEEDNGELVLTPV